MYYFIKFTLNLPCFLIYQIWPNLANFLEKSINRNFDQKFKNFNENWTKKSQFDKNWQKFGKIWQKWPFLPNFWPQWIDSGVDSSTPGVDSGVDSRSRLRALSAHRLRLWLRLRSRLRESTLDSGVGVDRILVSILYFYELV